MGAAKLSLQLAHEPWGEETVTLRIAGHWYRFEGLSASQVDIVLNRFAAAVSERNAEETLIIRLFKASESDLSSRPPLDEDAVIKSYPGHDVVEVVGVHFYGVLSVKPAPKGEVWTNKETGNDFRLAFENFFRLAVAYRVLRSGGLLLHSAGVMENGKADVFVGRSGYGKSTISKLRQAEGATVLSDDMIALKFVDGRLHAQAMPFTGDLDTWSQSASCYPVRALLHLQKGPANQLSGPFAVAETMSALMVCAPYVNADTHLGDSLLDCVERIARATPMRRLTFALGGGVGHYLDSVLD